MNELEELMKGWLYVPTGFNPSESHPEHGVIIHFFYGMDDLTPLYQFETELERTLEENNAGRYDGHEIAMDDTDGFLFFYGKNAEILFKAIHPLLKKNPWMKNAVALLRFGPAGEDASEIEVMI